MVRRNQNPRPAGGLFGQPVSRDTLSQQAYQVIRTSLMRSRLKPGQKLVARLERLQPPRPPIRAAAGVRR